ncbi:MAG TPA: 50S ribosomal protein L34 [Planctomycetes bacterium]|nr:50S ribosomal protein L34 [Planctomycetota bacterium]
MKTKIRKSRRKRAKKVGFRTRMKTRGGRAIIKRRRRIGRRLTPKI